MIQLVTASTLFQVASLAAMVDEDILGEAKRRVLVLASGSQQPELTTRIQDAPGFDTLSARFDAVVDLGALVWPRRPQAFSPREDELGMWAALLRTAWGLGEEPLELVLDSIQVNPAIALARVFHDAQISLHSDGLMAYGPSRNRLRLSMIQRLHFLAYAELVPGLTPVLMREHGIELRPLNPAALRAVMDEVADSSAPSAEASELMAGGGRTALALGQYLVPLGVLDEEEQGELDRSMLALAAQHGAETLAYKPHPSASVGSTERLRRDAEDAGLTLVVLPDDVPAEVLMGWLTPVVVVSGFSTSLFTATALYGLPAAAAATELVSARLRPFENGNRIPLTLADAVLGSRPALEPERLQALVNAVAYAMQSGFLGELRAEAVAFLGTEPELRDRYIRQRRLRALDLPHTPQARRKTGKRAAAEALLGVNGTQLAADAVRGLSRSPRKAAAALGSRLVTWSKRS